jgi:hypothetical protein
VTVTTRLWYYLKIIINTLTAVSVSAAGVNNSTHLTGIFI